jgi:hypothetical protein
MGAQVSRAGVRFPGGAFDTPAALKELQPLVGFGLPDHARRFADLKFGTFLCMAEQLRFLLL